MARIQSHILRLASFGFAQGLSSATNFTLSFLLSRVLSVENFGAMAIALTFVFFVVAGQRAAVGDPSLVYSPMQPRLITQARPVVISITFAALIAISASGFFILPLDLFFWLGVITFLVVLQDGHRYLVAASDGIQWVVLSDAIWVTGGGLALALAALNRINSNEGLAIWCISGLLANLVLLIRLRTSPLTSLSVRLFFRKTHELSKWAAIQFVVSNGALQLSVVLMTAFIGVTAFGGYKAIQLVASPVLVLLMALASPLLSWMSRRHDGKFPARRAVALSGTFTITTFLVCSVMWSAGAHLIQLLPGEQYASYLPILTPALLAVVFVAAALPLGTFIQTRRRGRLNFVSSATGILASSAIVVVASSSGSVEWAAWALCLQYFILLASTLVAFAIAQKKDNGSHH